MILKNAGPPGAQPSLDDDFRLLRSAVQAAGATALSRFRRGPRVMRKPDGSEVTEADLAVNDELHDALCVARPDYGWLSEESPDDQARLDAERVWIVDPIDGTRAFILGKAEWAISAALVEAGEPVLAALYNPATNEFFSASRCGGATVNGAPARVSDLDDLHGAHILTTGGVAKRAGWHGEDAPQVETSFVYSIAYRLALVASGRADGMFSPGQKSEWDIAAGVLIVQEAGGRVTTPSGEAHRFNKPAPVCDGALAAPRQLHGTLLSALQHRTDKVNS